MTKAMTVKEVKTQVATTGFRDAFNDVVPRTLAKHLTFERQIAILQRACQKVPKLAECSPASLQQGLLDGATLGLEVGGPLKHADLVPFKGQCQLIVGYRGVLELAKRSGELFGPPIVQWVYDNDEWDMDITDAEKPIVHKPCVKGPRGEPLFVYCLARFKAEKAPHFDFMTFDDVVEHKRRHVRGNSPAWEDSFEEMGKKTIILRSAKRWPMSSDLAQELQKVEAPSDYDPHTGEVFDEVVEGEVVAEEEEKPKPKAKPRKKPAKKKPEPEDGAMPLDNVKNRCEVLMGTLVIGWEEQHQEQCNVFKLMEETYQKIYGVPDHTLDDLTEADWRKFHSELEERYGRGSK